MASVSRSIGTLGLFGACLLPTLAACQTPSTKSDPPTSAPPVERNPPAAAPSAVVVRIVEVREKSDVVSRCLPAERLVGGGCDCDLHDRSTLAGFSGHPVDFGPTDTQGAGWRCYLPGTGFAGVYRAFALPGSGTPGTTALDAGSSSDASTR